LVLMLEVVYLLFLWKGSVLASFSAMTVLAPVKDSLRPVLIAVIAWIILAALLLLLGPWFSWAALGWVPSLPLIFGSIASLALCGICAQQLRRRQAARVAAIFIPVAAVVVVCFLLVFKIGGHSQNPFLYRYIHLTSGVSPLLPFLCLVAAGLWWAWFSLFGLALVDKRRPRLPAGGDLPAAVMYSAWLSEEFAEKLMRVARPSAWSRGVYGPALVLLAVTLSALSYGHPLLSLEARHYEWIFVLSLGVVTFALFCTLFRLLVIWLESHRILLALDRFPLRRAFGELNFAWQPIWRLGGGRWQDLYRLVSRQLETLDHLKPEAQKEGGGVGAVLVRSIEATAQERDELYQRYGVLLKPGNPDPNAKEPALSDYLIEEYRRLQESIAYTCAAAFSYLQPKWQKDEGLIVCEIASGEDVKKTEDNLKLPLSTRLAERFVALVYLNFILTALLRMRTLAITAGGLYIFLLLSVNSYPFEPRIALRSMAILLLMCVVGIVAYVFAQIHRDSILSLVTQTKPGELGVEFWVRIGTFTALPLLSLLVSQFPTLNNAVFSWLEPAVTALK
jgi:ABC-type multidrug transport system fused ATPase/permease subunit